MFVHAGLFPVDYAIKNRPFRCAWTGSDIFRLYKRSSGDAVNTEVHLAEMMSLVFFS